ncbi:MAG: hypothetical protein ACRCSP_09620, partial [Rhodoglobus sp.]
PRPGPPPTVPLPLSPAIVPPVTAPPIPVPSVSLAWEDTGDLVLGRQGMIGVSMTNTGITAVSTPTMIIDLPVGVTVDLPRTVLIRPPAGWSCVPAGASVSCSAVALDPGAVATVRLPISVAEDADTLTPLQVSARSGNTELARAAAAQPVLTGGFGATVILDGAYTIRVAGASFLDCDGSPQCLDARDRRGPPSRWDNNAWAMTEVADSVTQLDFAPSSTVAAATLYWSAYIPDGATDADLGGIALSAPGADAVSVVADRIDRTTIGGREVYQSSADVTELVTAGGAGQWAATGAPLVTGIDTYAGWSLVVVLEDPSLTPARVALFAGLARVDGSAAAAFEVAVVPGASATLGVLSWEGDGSRFGDALLVNDVPATPATGLGNPDNAFDSTVDGGVYANSFGVDTKFFHPVEMTAPRARLTATTGGDVYLIGAVTVESR